MKSSYPSNLHTVRRALKAARAFIESSVDNTRNATIEPDEKSKPCNTEQSAKKEPNIAEYLESMLGHARASLEASVVNTNPTNERNAMSITSNNEITEKGPQTRHIVVDTDMEFPGGSSDDGSDNDQWLESAGEQHAMPAYIRPTEREKPNGPAAVCIRLDSNHVVDSLWKKGKFRSVDTTSTPLDLYMERLAQRETAPPKPASEVTNDSLCKNGKMGSRRLDRTLDHLPIQPRGKKKRCGLHRWQSHRKEGKLMYCRSCNVNLCADCYDLFHKVKDVDNLSEQFCLRSKPNSTPGRTPTSTKGIKCTDAELAYGGSVSSRRLDRSIDHVPVRAKKKKKCSMHKWLGFRKEGRHLLYCRGCNVTLCTLCYDDFHKVHDIVAIKYWLKQEYLERGESTCRHFWDTCQPVTDDIISYRNKDSP